ncbi:MAG: TlpA disulfide reductase family protein [Planctomycetota bacterium]
MLTALLCVSLVSATQAADADPVATLQADVAAAYAELDTLRLAGSIDYVVEYADLRYERGRNFTADFDGTRFLHESDTGPTFARTDEAIFVYSPDLQSYQRYAVASGAERADLPPYLTGLAVENPALLLALTGGDLTPLIRGAGDLTVTDNDDTLTLSFEIDGSDVALVFDAETKLLRGREIDLRPALMADGIESVTEGRLTLTYATVEPGVALAAETFAWRPPAEAEPAEPLASLGDANALVGQAAPGFALDDLDGNPVALSDFAGKVVVLEFWATWCGPCVQSLPALAQLQTKYGEDVAVLALNQREDVPTIRAFLDRTGIDIAVLRDTDAGVAGQYGVSGLPTIIVVDRSGAVRHVFVGFGPETEGEIDAAVDEALREGGPTE